jgi:hypothetical protein
MWNGSPLDFIALLKTTGSIITIAGNGTEGYAGDGGDALNAKISTQQYLY